MNRDLLKNIIRRIGSLSQNIVIEGYTQNEIKQVIERLVQEGILIKGKASVYGRNALGYTGEPKEIESYVLMEYKLRFMYGPLKK